MIQLLVATWQLDDVGMVTLCGDICEDSNLIDVPDT